MSFISRKFVVAALFALLAACRAADEPAYVAGRGMAPPFAANRQDEESIKREQSALKSFMEVDDRPIHLKVDEQIKRVVVEKTVVKPVYFADGNPQLLSDSEIKHMLENVPTSRDLKNGVEYDEYGLGVIVGNYKNILNASASCCPFRVSEGMKAAGFFQDEILAFLERDSNGPSLQNMCMLASDSEIDRGSPGARLARVFREARDSCVCNNADYLKESLANFYSIYRLDRDFYDKALIFSFRDANGRTVKQDMLDSVMKITAVLRACP
jgi:hypothetical protein